MDFKKFWKESFGGFVLKRILLAIAVLVVLSWISLLIIDSYTKHGEAEVVPNLDGMNVEEAQLVLANHGLFAQVIDSVYIPEKKLGTIVVQVPEANSTVKRNRAIFVIINSKKVRHIPLPELQDVSYRQADAMLKSIGLKVSSVIYAPSEYKDLVVDVRFGGRSVHAGSRIPVGASLVLVVGNGLGDTSGAIPSLKGMSLEAARQLVLADSMIIGSVEYDVKPSGNEKSYVIYRQQPSAGEAVSVGSRIDVWLTRDMSKLETQEETETEPTGHQTTDEEDFF